MNILSKPWLWKGRWADAGSLIRACLVAPLSALIPPLLFILGLRVIFGPLIPEYDRRMFVFVTIWTLGISYGVTIMIGLPWYLALSRFGRAGLIPVISAVFPLMGTWFALTAVKGHHESPWTYLFFLVCGLLPATAFWKIASAPGPDSGKGASARPGPTA